MILHGRNLIIKNDGVAVAAAKSCTIDVRAEDIEVSSPLTGKWKTYIAGRKSWQVDVSGLIAWTQASPTGDVMGKLRMGGSMVELECALQADTDMYPGLKTFAGWNQVTEEEIVFGGLTRTPEAIYFSEEIGKFVALYESKWYDTWYGGWGYMAPSEGAWFLDESTNVLYTWDANYPEQVAELTMLSGTALCKQMRVGGTLGNLASYTAQFQGSGELVGLAIGGGHPAHVPASQQSRPGVVQAADGGVTLTQTGAEVQALLNKVASLELATDADIVAAFGGE